MKLFKFTFRLLWILALTTFSSCSNNISENNLDINTAEYNCIRHKYALLYINNVISRYEALPGLYIHESKIIYFHKAAVFDHILPATVELWHLDFHLKPNDIDKVRLDVRIEDSWITNSNDNRVHLIFSHENTKIKYIGYIPHWIARMGTQTNWEMEIALRQFLEYEGFLPFVTFPGNHYFAYFFHGNLNGRLLLSQPVIQGETGIWVVERWQDMEAIVNDAFPGNPIISVQHSLPLSVEKTMMEYFTELQRQFDDGKAHWLVDPYEVARRNLNNWLSPYAIISGIYPLKKNTEDPFSVTQNRPSEDSLISN